jgi:hypothetical protein
MRRNRPGQTLNYGQPVNWQSPLNRGLVSWWLVLPQRMGGLRLQDLCRTYHGTLTNGPTWNGARGRPGGWGAIKFDNTSGQKVNIGTVTDLDLTADFTVSCWFYSANTSTDGLFGNAQDTVTQNFYVASFSGTIFVVWGGTTISNTVTNSANTWTHLAVTRKGSSGSWDWAIYKNGISAASGNSAVNPSGGSYNTSLGFVFTDNPLNGLIDDVRVYKRALSAGEIRALYDDSRTSYPTTLNYINPFVPFQSAGGGGATAFPWHYYQQMMAG